MKAFTLTAVGFVLSIAPTASAASVGGFGFFQAFGRAS